MFKLQHTCCPVCKAKVSKGTNKSASTLPTNYALKALVEEDNHPFDKDSISRSFGECPTHSETCDQFCRTCERQLCKKCVSDNHGAPDHDTAPVLAVVVQQTEVTEKLASELQETVDILKGIEEKIMTSVRTCETEANQINKEINTSATQASQIISDQAESLQTVVEGSKRDMLKYLGNLRLEHSELSLSATYAVDLCKSLQMDLNINNLSRVAVIKRLNYSSRKIKSRLEKLEGKRNDFNLGLRFQSLTQEPKIGKVVRRRSEIPVAKHMRTISLTDDVAYGGLRGFIWPFPYWMMAVSVRTIDKHHIAEFYNVHFFVQNHFTQEIGIDNIWSYVSNSDCSGKYVLCLGVGKIHKLLLPSKENEQRAGKIVSTIFLPTAANAIAWDEKQVGCYALLQDKKTLLHVEFEGEFGGQSRYREVAVFEEEMPTKTGTHTFHVNAEGSIAICDHTEKVVHFFEKIGTEPTVTVKASPGFQTASPQCVSTRREDKNWYVLWRRVVTSGPDNLVKRSHYSLAVYDPSFKFLGCVHFLKVTDEYYHGERAMFCFQEDYLAVITSDEIALHVLTEDMFSLLGP
ncbi:hypothetical protein HOLleu_06916 [Holothuria leucospilota]|uniref:B box-type domain-containing protein n=1 Tax=Holothuria leucospilota TaxID=206669 RepID=A0A9Q1CNL4_HOLLE|nr:hypothetical protein HOLleu_06916 [Holothuria leucospilota]